MYPSIRHCNQSFKEKMMEEHITEKRIRPKKRERGTKFTICVRLHPRVNSAKELSIRERKQ